MNIERYKLKNFYFRNILFLFIIVFSLLLVSMLNYLVDPYNLFKKDVNSVDFIFLPSKLIYPYFKINKSQPCYRLIIGGSESLNLLGPRVDKTTHYISRGAIEEFPELLEAYTDLHPEINEVIVCFSTIYTFRTKMLDGIIYTGKNLNLREFFDVFLSFEMIKKTIKVLNKIDYKYKNAPTEKMTVRPNYIIKYNHTNTQLEEKQKNIYSSVNKIISILEAKNIKYTFVLTPINSIYSAITYKNKSYREKIQDFKRYLVSKVPVVYDFSIPTIFSNISLFDENNFYWQDFVHISYMFGIKYYKILFDEKNSDASLYYKLTNDNIEQSLLLENKLILDYINNNKNNVDYYTNIVTSQDEIPDLKLLLFYSYDRTPQDLKKEVVYFDANIHELKKSSYKILL